MVDAIRRLIFNDTNNCPICLERCENPKVLPCLHSFCSNCLCHITSRNAPGLSIRCPLCQQENRIPNGGYSDFHDIVQLREEVRFWLAEGQFPVRPDMLNASQPTKHNVRSAWLVGALVVVVAMVASASKYSTLISSDSCRQSFQDELLDMEFGIDLQSRRQLTRAQLLRTVPKEKPLWGITAFDGKLFVVEEAGTGIDVFDLRNLTRRLFSISIPRLGTVADMVVDIDGRYLFVSDTLNAGIHRVEWKTKEVRYWSVHDKPHGLSVNADDGHLLVTFPEVGVVKEYTRLGTFVRRIKLAPDIVNPWHAILLGVEEKRGTVYLVTNGGRSDDENGACRVDSKGKTLRCLRTFLTPLSSPIRGHVIGDHVIVADENNRRVLMMTKGFEYVWTLATELRGAIRMWFDEYDEILYVVVNEWKKDAFVRAHVKVFEII